MDKADKVFKKVAEIGNLKMALSQMDKVKDYAHLLQCELLERHAEGHILIPAWVASKVTKAEDYLNSAYDYMSANNYKYAEDENARRLKRGAGAALGLAGTIGAASMIKKRPNYIKTKFRGDSEPLLKRLQIKGQKLKEKINEHQIMQDDYLTAHALAKHGPMDKKNKAAIKRMQDEGIIALASLTIRSANKKK